MKPHRGLIGFVLGVGLFEELFKDKPFKQPKSKQKAGYLSELDKRKFNNYYRQDIGTKHNKKCTYNKLQKMKPLKHWLKNLKR